MDGVGHMVSCKVRLVPNHSLPSVFKGDVTAVKNVWLLSMFQPLLFLLLLKKIMIHYLLLIFCTHISLASLSVTVAANVHQGRCFEAGN